jgi:hypothetical protein
VVDDFAWGPLIEALERELRARDMTEHLALLAPFRARYARESRRLQGLARPPWTTETLVELAACFQIAPFDDYYPVAAHSRACPHCQADLSGREVATTRAVLPGRRLHSCKHCHGRWLVLEEVGVTRRKR